MLTKSVFALILLIGFGCEAKFKVPIKQVKSVGRDRPHRGDRWELYGDNEELYDYYDSEYIGSVHLGTPPQHFDVVFDTSTANLWITDEECECNFFSCRYWISCIAACERHCCDGSGTKTSNSTPTVDQDPETNAVVCANKRKFRRKESTSYKENGEKWSISYPQGRASGVLATDTLTIGDLVIEDVTFGRADSLDKGFAGDPLDGIFGLAFQAIAVDGVKPPIIQAIDEDLLDEPLFTFWLKSDGPNSRGELGGAITFGDIDGDNCGFIMAYEPLISETTWKFRVAAVTINGESDSTGWNTISDSGTSYIGLPKTLFNKLLSASHANYDKKTKRYSVDCKADFKLSFKIGTYEYAVEAQKVIFNDGHDNCQLSAFESNGVDVQIILGVPFMRQFCHIFDYTGQIGFAKAY